MNEGRFDDTGAGGDPDTNAEGDGRSEATAPRLASASPSWTLA
jgi:hypothetical protein